MILLCKHGHIYSDTWRSNECPHKLVWAWWVSASIAGIIAVLSGILIGLIIVYVIIGL